MGRQFPTLTELLETIQQGHGWRSWNPLAKALAASPRTIASSACERVQPPAKLIAEVLASLNRTGNWRSGSSVDAGRLGSEAGWTLGLRPVRWRSQGEFLVGRAGVEPATNGLKGASGRFSQQAILVISQEHQMFEITPNLSPSPDFALALWQGNGTEQPLDSPDGIEVKDLPSAIWGTAWDGPDLMPSSA